MGKRILNPEVKEYLIKFVIDTLENCDLFVKTFGSGFAESRLNDNLREVYTNEKSSTSSGYYDFADKSITLCESGVDDKLLAPEDIDSSENKKATILHEAIHAILRKLKEECEEIGVVDVTGIMESYKDDSELGRGLNEGLTNWIVEKAGLKPNGYETLTNVIRMLELAIGSERVMNLGKGSIHDNIQNTLGITEKDTTNLLVITDEYYNTSEIYEKMIEITSILSSKRRDDGNIILTDDDVIELVNLKFYFYTNPETNKRYINFLNEKGLEDTIETKFKYCEMYKEQLEKSLMETQNCIDSTIFELFFMERFSNIKEITKEEFDYFLKLEKLMGEESSDKSKSSVIFKNEFKNRLIINKISKIKEKVDLGTITTSEFLEMIDMLDSDNVGLSNQRLLFYTLISENIYPENSSCIKELIEKLKNKGNIDEIDRYSFQEIKTSTGEKICLYYKDGEIDFAGSSYCADGMKASDKIEDLDNIFDYTPPCGKDLQDAVNSFLKFKETTEKRDPKATIRISNRAIILETSSGKKAFFMVDDNGNIVPATPVKDEQTRINFAKEKEDKSLIVPKKENFISKFVKNMRDRIIKRKVKNASDIDSTEIHTEDRKESEWDEFDKRLKNFTPVENPTNTHKSYNNRDFRTK